MAYYIVRYPSNRLRVVEDFEGVPTKEMIYHHNEGATLYRVSPVGDGTFLLTPQQIAAGSEVTEQRTISAVFEDATP